VRKAPAILFSLLLAWTQVAVGMQSAPNRQTARPSCCCDCRCCVTPASPSSTPAPVAPARASDQNQLSIPSLAAPAWSLPGVEAQIFSSFTPSSLTATGVPLYTRHCALLV